MDMNSSDQSIDAVLTFVKSAGGLTSKAPRFAGHFACKSCSVANRRRRGAVTDALAARRSQAIDARRTASAGATIRLNGPERSRRALREIAQWRIASRVRLARRQEFPPTSRSLPPLKGFDDGP